MIARSARLFGALASPLAALSMVLLSQACSGGTSEDAPQADASAEASTNVDEGGSGQDAAPQEGGGGFCAVSSPIYAVSGAKLFATTADLKRSQEVATVRSPSTNAPLEEPVLFARSGSGELIVSSATCKLCRVDPKATQDGVVVAELLRDDLDPVRLGDSPAASTVLIVTGATGSPLVEAFNTSTKLAELGVEVPLSSATVTCAQGVDDVEGTVGDGTYDLHVLASCSDDVNAASSAYLTTTGTFTNGAPQSAVQATHAIVAWSKNSAATYSVARMKVAPQAFVGAQGESFHVGAALDFVLDDPSPYERCNAAGKAEPAAPIF